MLRNGEIILRKATEADKLALFQLLTTDEEWTKFDGPYFPYQTPSLEDFERGMFARFSQGRDALLIELNGEVIGSVSCYWQDKRTRWLEAGIAIYDHSRWSKGLGRKALVPWISHLFATREIARVGMTTWSGNPRMVACAQAVGLQIEGVLRRVRYHDGEYYDSVRLGVLREEWADLHLQENSQ